MPNRKHKRRLLWAFIILLLLFSGGKLMIATIMPNDQPEQKQKNNPQPQKTEIKIAEAERVFQDVFCYCTIEDMIEAQRIASEHTLQFDSPIIETVGGQECLSGFYDLQKDIVYMSSIFSHDNFHDASGDINGRADQYQLRDFYLNNGVVTYDLYSLDRPDYYNQPIIWRIHSPELVNDVSDTAHYSRVSGQPGYNFMRIDDRSLSWYWAAREHKNKKAIMVQRPSDDYSSSFEEYAEILGIDLSQFIFIDIQHKEANHEI